MQAGSRTFSIAERAIELMKAYGASASPRSYEVWFTYVTGLNPALNEALRRATEQGGKVSDPDLDSVYELHVSPTRFLDEAARASAAMLGEIDQVSDLLAIGLGSAERYGDSLAAATTGLATAADPRALASVLESVLRTTRDVAAANKGLEMRLRESRREIQVLRSTLETARREATLDPLTGLGNRKHFESMLHDTVEAARQTGQPLSIALVDLDRFSRFNDAYGHATGDQILRLVASAIRDRSPAEATLARFGGEEFGVMLPGCSATKALACAEAIRLDVMARELVNRSTESSLGRITVSLGVASLGPDDTPAELVRRALSCLDGAKQGGRNRIVADFLPDAPGELKVA